MPRDFGVTTRARLGLALHATPSLALIPAYLLPRPAVRLDGAGAARPCLPRWPIIAVRHDVPLPVGRRLRRDRRARADRASRSSVRCPRFAVIFPPIAVNALTGRERLLRAGNLANLAVLRLVHARRRGCVLAALRAEPGSAAAFAARRSSASCCSSSTSRSARSIYATAVARPPAAQRRAHVPGRRPGRRRHDHARRAHRRPLRRTSGCSRSRLFALVAVLPQSALTFVARTRPGRRNSTRSPRRAATRTRSRIQLGLAARRAPASSTTSSALAHARACPAIPREHLGHTVVDWSEASCAAGHVTEWWNGAGGPAGLPGRLIPLAGADRRRGPHLGVAHRGGQPVPQPRRRRSRTSRAPPACGSTRPWSTPCADVMGQERASAAVPAPEPRMHRLHVPAPLRRMLAAGVDRRRAVLAPRVGARTRPARRRSPRRAGPCAPRPRIRASTSSGPSAARYGRLETMESKTSATVMQPGRERELVRGAGRADSRCRRGARGGRRRSRRSGAAGRRAGARPPSAAGARGPPSTRAA